MTSEVASPHVQNVLDRLQKVRPSGKGWTSLCPAHPDKNTSLSIWIGKKGEAALKCHAGCEWSAVVAALGIKKSDLYPPRQADSFQTSTQPIATYDYTDEQGARLYSVLRYYPKAFNQCQYDVPGRRVWGLSKGIYWLSPSGWKREKAGAPPTAERREFPAVRRVLFHLQSVLATAKAGGIVHLTEGEKDVINLQKLLASCSKFATTSETATTYAQGAKQPWTQDYTEAVQGASLVVIHADNDDPGTEGARLRAAAIHAAGIPVKIVSYVEKDVSDWISSGGSLEQLQDILDDTPLWSPPPLPEYANIEEFRKALDEKVTAYWDRQTGEKIELGKCLASIVKGTDYGEKKKVAEEILGNLVHDANRARTIVDRFIDANILAVAKFNRPFDLYYAVSQAPTQKRPELLARVDTFETGLTAEKIREELRGAGELPPKSSGSSKRMAQEAQSTAARKLEQCGITERSMNALAELANKEGGAHASRLVEIVAGVAPAASCSKFATTEPADPALELTEDESIETSSSIYTLLLRNRELEERVREVYQEKRSVEQQLEEERRQRCVEQQEHEALYTAMAEQIAALRSQLSPSASKQSEEAITVPSQQTAAPLDEEQPGEPDQGANCAQPPPDRRQLARRNWPRLVCAIEARSLPTTPFKARYPNGLPYESSNLRQSARYALDLFLTLDDEPEAEEQAAARLTLVEDVWCSLEARTGVLVGGVA